MNQPLTKFTKLPNGVEMPTIGFGTWQIPLNENFKSTIQTAIQLGYRHFDTAQIYNNSVLMGEAIRESGIPRSEFFITSKIWVSNMNYERAAASIDETLRKLGTNYVDLMLLHQMMGDYTGAYRAMEDACKAGKIRAIGVSNCYPERLLDLCMLAEIPPAVNQIETHPFLQENVAHANMEELGVVHEAWAPFAEGRNNLFAHPVLSEIGGKHGKTAGQVALRALLQEGIVVIPKTVHRVRMEENFAVFDFALDADDMAAFRALDDLSFKRIFDHHDLPTIKWMLGDLVKKQQFGGAALY